MKAKPITAKASGSVCKNMEQASMAKYMASLVGDLKGMYASKKYIDPGKEFKKGLDDAKENSDDFDEFGGIGRDGDI